MSMLDSQTYSNCIGAMPEAWGHFELPPAAPKCAAEIDAAVYAALSSVDSDWLCAVEAADLLKHSLCATFGAAWPCSYRPVAFALRRLAKAGLVQERIATYRGKHRSKEERREYRLFKAQTAPAGALMSLFPTVQPIPPGVARRVRGRDMRN